MSFLETALANMALAPDTEGYLLGRGAKEETIEELGIKTWTPLPTPHDDKLWRERYGPDGRGEWIKGWAILPIYSPRGRLLGFEGRNPNPDKGLKASHFYLPEASWNPIWLGMRPSVMQKIWDGGAIWVSEGYFDAFPLEWAIPEGDVSMATARARLGDKHLQFLCRFLAKNTLYPKVHMAYDNDETGRKATHGYVDEKTGKERWGALRKLSKAGIDNRHVPYAGVKDPGEIWDKHGPSGMRATFKTI
jgi:DNA primase